jgi:hypothetical protein
MVTHNCPSPKAQFITESRMLTFGKKVLTSMKLVCYDLSVFDN